LLNSDSHDKNDLYDKAWASIEKYLIEQKCNGLDVIKYYKDFLQTALACDIQIIEQIPSENIFGDYQPKLTPDELYDYMPAIYDEVQRLPGADLKYIPELLENFKKYQKLAIRHPGKWVDGNVILGANPREYEPSFEELILSEIGSRIQIIRENNQQQEIHEIAKQKMRWPQKIKFRKFSVIHIDVMGSGRFFYISNIEEVKFSLY
jgi:hypothetical protein